MSYYLYIKNESAIYCNQPPNNKNIFELKKNEESKNKRFLNLNNIRGRNIRESSPGKAQKHR